MAWNPSNASRSSIPTVVTSTPIKILKEPNYPNGILITRPNNATAYAVGDVWGADPDAAIHVQCADPPAGYRIGGYRWVWTNSRAPADSALQLNVIAFNAQPAAVADNAPLSLSDADIAKIILPLNTFASVNFASGPAAPHLGFNTTAGINGRRRAVTSIANLLTVSQGDIGQIWVSELPQDFWMFLVAATAEAPVALETIQLDIWTMYYKALTQ